MKDQAVHQEMCNAVFRVLHEHDCEDTDADFVKRIRAYHRTRRHRDELA